MTTTPPVPLPRPAPADSPATANIHAPTQKPRCVPSQELLGKDKTLAIEHEGVVYQLRATRLGKLILTK